MAVVFNPALKKVLDDLPMQPRSADIALLLMRAEAAGYERACRELEQRQATEVSGIEATEIAHETDLAGECLPHCRACALSASALLSDVQ